MTTGNIYLSDISQRPAALRAWERQKNKKEVYWFAECFAEALGVFFYVYAGVGSTAGWVIGNIIKQPLSSIFQIGMAYALGVFLALAVCSATSGGHFSPGVTIALVVFKKFPPIKAIRYIVAQIFGAYIACALIYVQYKELITVVEGALEAEGALNAVNFTPNGPAGIFALYLLPGQTLGRAFFTEWTACTLLSMVIWAALDPTNVLIPPSLGPITVAMGFATIVWGFAAPGIALNTARDLGGRLFAISIWGTAANGGMYAAICSLTNIPATIFGIILYELFLTDSDRVIPAAQLEMARVTTGHRRIPHGPVNSAAASQSDDDISGKVVEEKIMHARA